MAAGSRNVVIGAGIAGLAAALDLGQRGLPVTVLEAEPVAGGLASSLQISGVPVERFYHFICGGDHELLDLIRELKLGESLRWEPSDTAFFHDGRLHAFSTPGDLLRFSPIPMSQRIRFGINIIRGRYRRAWKKLDRLAAGDWLRAQVGDKAYEVIWEPLLRTKFGARHREVSAAWIWHRVNRVARSRGMIWEKERFGFLRGGSDQLVAALLARLRGLRDVEVRTGARVERIVSRSGRVIGVEVAGCDETISARSVLATVALGTLPRIAPGLDADYCDRAGRIKYLGVICGLLKLARPITGAFWTNINDPRIPFSGIIEYTTLNRGVRAALGGSSLVYIPHYLCPADPRNGYRDEQLYREYVAGLRLLNPAFEEHWIEECHISRASHAQAVCSVGFQEQVLGHRTPLAGLFVTDSTQNYPEDRTLAGAVRLGRRAATIIAEEAG